VIDYCGITGINPIVLGTGERNSNSFEPVLCKRFNKFFKHRVEDQNVSYIETINI
jgi:hypothetical protein